MSLVEANTLGDYGLRELAVGFDIREPLLDDRFIEWTEKRRSKFLLQPQIRWPLSVDPSVWRRVKPGNDSHPLRMWFSPSEVAATCPSVIDARRDGPIGIKIYVLGYEDSITYWKDVFDGWSHPDRGSGTASVIQDFGFDVADRFLLSGLTNCMFSPDELSDLRRTWSGRLNSFGLFTTANDAEQFRLICDRFVAEHSPFFVFRISRIVFEIGKPK